MAIYSVPDSLRWALRYKLSTETVGEELWARDCKRLMLMAQTLVYGMTKLQGTYPVWSVWPAFRGRVGRDTIADWARAFEKAGILTLPKWENRPRVVNFDNARVFIKDVVAYCNAKPLI